MKDKIKHGIKPERFTEGFKTTEQPKEYIITGDHEDYYRKGFADFSKMPDLPGWV